MRFTIIRYSDIDNNILRLEAEYYNYNSTITGNYYTGNDIIDFVQYGTSEELNEDNLGYPTLRLNEFSSLFIQKPIKYCNKINEDKYNSLKLKKGDVLICRTNGNPKLVGKSAIVPKDYNYAFASYLFRVRPNPKKILSSVLVVYLNSFYGRAEIEKCLMVGNQANFSPAKFREILIPNLNNSLQVLIDKYLWQAYMYHEESIAIYSQAQLMLLTELGLNNWQPEHQKYFLVNYSDTSNDKRIDAEYYQPKYDEIIERINRYTKGCNKLSQVISINDKNIIPTTGNRYKYIELADIGNNGEILSYTEELGDNLPTRARRLVNNNNVIVSSIEGSLDKIALVEKRHHKSLCSTGFYVLSSDIINPETMLVYFKSLAGQLQLKRGCRGTILTAINKSDLEEIVIPLIKENIQADIALKIKLSFELRNRSNTLLYVTKKGVELAIEKDEKTAIDWMEKETCDLTDIL